MKLQCIINAIKYTGGKPPFRYIGVKMKYIFTCCTICLIAIIVCVWMKIDTRQKELEIETQIKLLQMQEVIEQQSKEIRIIRQDMDLLERGFE